MFQTSRPSTRSLTYLIIALMLLVSLSACGALGRKPKPTPLPTRAVGLQPTPGLPGDATQVAPAVVTAAAMSAETAAVETAAAAAAESGRAAACPPPTGWVGHSVRQSETLFYLATSTGVSVEEVMKANCLSSDLLQVGQRLYLPSNPPLRPTAAPVAAQPAQPTSPPVQPTSAPLPEPTTAPIEEPTSPPPLPTPTYFAGCASSFSCTNPSLPPFNVRPQATPTAYGAPTRPPESTPPTTLLANDPCRDGQPAPWISSPSRALAIGSRAYFFVCQFTKPILSAQLIKPGNVVEPVELLAESPKPDLELGSANAVLTWPALPDQNTGSYTLKIQGTDEEASFQFEVLPAAWDTILINPVSGPPGTTFSVYYIFDLDGPRKILLYSQDEVGRATWEVSVSQPLPNNKAWVMVPLPSAVTDPKTGYMVAYKAPWQYFGLPIYDMLWLK